MDPLGIGQCLLWAALAFVAVALVCDVVIVTAGRRPRDRSPVRIVVGANSADTSADRDLEMDPEALTGVEADAQAVAPDQEGPAPDKPPLMGGSLRTYATWFTSIALALVTGYLAIRMGVSGHGPFSNQHEFAVAFAWGILAAYLVAHWRFRVAMLAVAVEPVAGCLMLYALNLDATVAPLVPALQNSVLLTLHVGFAIAAYGAACVSFGAAAIYLLHARIGQSWKTPAERFDDIGYRSAVVTFPLLTAMIVLGSLWAETAWGRYWGWDPKETAALVTWLIYAAYLHARVARGWRGRRAAWLLVVGFAAVLFAYFGNHFFGGLHSYG
ncbi:MAG: c-type cytochrome biogenesis protein CcsB [Bifidobacteriaceae bacterium]|jgi:cytochrome c-type biogenesis protein CcsB|nr:c-type cytochrome biogenesis protein CcsB [Bifidobacteriaceae bacterium]